jgi:hypothetical protein
VLVRVSGDADAFANALRSRGLGVTARDDGLDVSGGDADAIVDAVRDAAADTGVGLREVRSAGPTLEDALVDALE